MDLSLTFKFDFECIVLAQCPFRNSKHENAAQVQAYVRIFIGALHSIVGKKSGAVQATAL